MSTTQINKAFVEILGILSEHEVETTKFKQLRTVLGSITFNEKLLLRYCSSYDESAPKDLVYFKNTQFEDIYNTKCTEEERKTITTKLSEIYNIAQEVLKNIHLPVETDIISLIMNDKTLRACLGVNKGKISEEKIRHILDTHPELSESIEKYVRTHMNTKNMDDELPNPINSLFSNECFDKLKNLDTSGLAGVLMKNIMGNKDNDIFKKIFEKIVKEHPEIMEGLQEVFSVFKTPEMKLAFENVANMLKDVDFNDMDSVMKKVMAYVSENNSASSILWKMHTTIESGLVDIDKFRVLSEKVLKIAVSELVGEGLMTNEDHKSLMSLIKGTPVRKSKKSKKNSKEMRSKRRIKVHRRRMRKDIKKKKKRK